MENLFDLEYLLKKYEHFIWLINFTVFILEKKKEEEKEESDDDMGFGLFDWNIKEKICYCYLLKAIWLCKRRYVFTRIPLCQSSTITCSTAKHQKCYFRWKFWTYYFWDFFTLFCEFKNDDGKISLGLGLHPFLVFA